MTITAKTEAPLLVPPKVQKQAGIKVGDRLKFEVSPRTITITVVPAPYKPTKSDLAAIRKGEAQIGRGEIVTLPEILDGVDRRRREGGRKTARKISR